MKAGQRPTVVMLRGVRLPDEPPERAKANAERAELEHARRALFPEVTDGLIRIVHRTCSSKSVSAVPR
jgi:hypothetical protein